MDDYLQFSVIKGDVMSIPITEDKYAKGLVDCSRHLHARLVMSKGEKPYTVNDLSLKLSNIWKTPSTWKMVTLGRGFCEFKFSAVKNLRLVWAQGTVNLKSGVFHLSQWTKDFNLYTQHKTHAQIWISLMGFPQEYWREKTLMETVGAVGTPLLFDAPTQNRVFGQYARVLVDMALLKCIVDEILV